MPTQQKYSGSIKYEMNMNWMVMVCVRCAMARFTQKQI